MEEKILIICITVVAFLTGYLQGKRSVSEGINEDDYKKITDRFSKNETIMKTMNEQINILASSINEIMKNNKSDK